MANTCHRVTPAMKTLGETWEWTTPLLALLIFNLARHCQGASGVCKARPKCRQSGTWRRAITSRLQSGHPRDRVAARIDCSSSARSYRSKRSLTQLCRAPLTRSDRQRRTAPTRLQMADLLEHKRRAGEGRLLSAVPQGGSGAPSSRSAQRVCSCTIEVSSCALDDRKWSTRAPASAAEPEQVHSLIAALHSLFAQFVRPTCSPGAGACQWRCRVAFKGGTKYTRARAHLDRPRRARTIKDRSALWHERCTTDPESVGG
jgi:hypothetical protein